MLMQYQEHKNLIERIAKNNGFKNYKLDVKSGSEKDDGYLSKMAKVTIKDENRALYLVVKMAPTNEEFRRSLPISRLYTNEICVYEKVFPALKQFQQDNGLLDGFEGYPKWYGVCNKENREAIAMEDLVENGYRTWSRKIPMDNNHIALVMSEYGKLHAVSFAMRKKDPQLFKELQKFVVHLSESAESRKNVLKMYVTNALSKIGKAVEGNIGLEKALRMLMKEGEKFFIEDLEEEEEYKVLSHADCWSNNMLFKYKNAENISPSEVCLIDWQLAGFHNPVYDISYFFCTSSTKEILLEYKTYLKIYYESMSSSLKSMSCDPEEVYPFSLFVEHWKKYVKAGLFFSPIVFALLAVDTEDVVNLEENVRSTNDLLQNLSKTGTREELINQKLVDLMTFMLEQEFI